ncbi:hypothetical protein CC86DRAFT_456106 [Ophiobolus disseminans]|uniref:Uncharacterized protein n=1 Tax=Ophiobolus disseminans TaxID=1469910 RepID=A0A6A6ZZD6_9PLEO|nr:hypothetical protein CC86DRAFT_456106 [Ophiobolus disseminans]
MSSSQVPRGRSARDLAHAAYKDDQAIAGEAMRRFKIYKREENWKACLYQLHTARNHIERERDGRIDWNRNYGPHKGVEKQIQLKDNLLKKVDVHIKDYGEPLCRDPGPNAYISNLATYAVDLPREGFDASACRKSALDVDEAWQLCLTDDIVDDRDGPESQESRASEPDDGEDLCLWGSANSVGQPVDEVELREDRVEARKRYGRAQVDGDVVGGERGMGDGGDRAEAEREREACFDLKT